MTQRLVRESFERQALMHTLGARIERVEDGLVEIALPNDPKLHQQHGFAHAGAITSIADSACGYACLTRMPEKSNVLSVEFKINLLAPAAGDEFRAVGQVLRSGRTISVGSAEVYAYSKGVEPKLIAAMQATMMRVDLGERAG